MHRPQLWTYVGGGGGGRPRIYHFLLNLQDSNNWWTCCCERFCSNVKPGRCISKFPIISATYPRIYIYIYIYAPLYYRENWRSVLPLPTMLEHLAPRGRGATYNSFLREVFVVRIYRSLSCGRYRSNVSRTSAKSRR